MTKFSERAWQATAGLRQKILDLPFNRELASGTLSQARFQFYMIQDALYLEQYSRALAVAAAKAPDPRPRSRHGFGVPRWQGLSAADNPALQS